MKRHFLSVCAALFALTVLCSVTAYAADNVYAILYDDSTMVFQNGDTPESGKTVKKKYKVDLNAVYTWDDDTQSADTPWYDERESVRIVNFADKISPTATAYWFDSCSNLERVDNIQNLDTTNVTDMSYMFYGCSSLTALDVSHFSTANVTNMDYVFYKCSGLTALDVSRWDTSNVTTIHAIFGFCSGLKALDVSRFDIANAQNIRSMFNGCSSLTTLNLSNFNTANATNMGWMFWNCKGLTVLDLSSFDTANAQWMDDMFCNCTNLKTIYVSDKFRTVSATKSVDMFNNCTSLVGGNGTKFDSNYTDKAYARIDTPSAPGYFTNIWDVVKSHIITAYVGEGGTVTPTGDCRVRAGDSQKYTITPNPGYAVRSVRVDGADMGALSEYTFRNVIKDHTLSAFFEKLPRYAITSAVTQKGELSVTLENSAAVTVAVSYFDKNGKFLSIDLQSVSANAGSVTFALPFAYAARVALFDTDFRPLCDPVTAE